MSDQKDSVKMVLGMIAKIIALIASSEYGHEFEV